MPTEIHWGCEYVDIITMPKDIDTHYRIDLDRLDGLQNGRLS
jgi:hypothetical protein